MDLLLITSISFYAFAAFPDKDVLSGSAIDGDGMTTLDDLKQHARDLISSSKPPSLDLARTLYEIHKEDVRDFNELVAKPKSGPQKAKLSSRKAYYLLKIAEQYQKLPRFSSRLQAIGWTKLTIIGERITRENAAQLIELAETHTVPQLRSRLTRKRTPKLDGKKPTKRKCILLYFNQKQYRIFEEAILKNGAGRPKKGRGLVRKEQAIIKALKRA